MYVALWKGILDDALCGVYLILKFQFPDSTKLIPSPSLPPFLLYSQ